MQMETDYAHAEWS